MTLLEVLVLAGVLRGVWPHVPSGCGTTVGSIFLRLAAVAHDRGDERGADEADADQAGDDLGDLVRGW